MKSIETVNKELIEIQSECASYVQRKKLPPKSLIKKIRDLRDIKYYLETSPKENFLIRQLEDIDRKIKVLEERFTSWKKHCSEVKTKTGSQAKSFYENLFGMKKMRLQRKTLRYLLTDNKF